MKRKTKSLYGYSRPGNVTGKEDRPYEKEDKKDVDRKNIKSRVAFINS